MQKGTKLTSVEVQEDLYMKFKSVAPLHKMTFKKLLDRSIYLYLKDIEFKNKVDSQTEVKL